METVELIVYLTIAVAIGGLLLAFVGGWDPGGAFSALKQVFEGTPADQYEKISAAALPGRVLAFWQGCGLGTVSMKKAVYIDDTQVITKQMLFSYYVQTNVCKSIQSAAALCGQREDVIDFAPIQGPALIQLECINATSSAQPYPQLRIATS